MQCSETAGVLLCLSAHSSESSESESYCTRLLIPRPRLSCPPPPSAFCPSSEAGATSGFLAGLASSAPGGASWAAVPSAAFRFTRSTAGRSLGAGASRSSGTGAGAAGRPPISSRSRWNSVRSLRRRAASRSAAARAALAWSAAKWGSWRLPTWPWKNQMSVRLSCARPVTLTTLLAFFSPVSMRTCCFSRLSSVRRKPTSSRLALSFLWPSPMLT
mmetsp:Transcript_13849/g.32964  ORF Transcript_13849/g.32964 Transcript_13849/m.32964 type:complete len:216 (-) Transcript_13849:210-857(-)